MNEGSKINNFHILRQTGEGGMGEVYLAEDEYLGRKVAMKVLNPVFTADQQFIERFKLEAKVQASLNHSAIVQLHSFFVFENKYIMVMEYAEGITLKQLIQKTGPIPEERTMKIFNQICAGIQYAHNKGIIHRDIKPSNIMIDAHDQVKIMDFGIAKILGDKGMTRTGAKMGTLYYMSPEQVMAQKDIDHRTDIYSLGITLFEMLTGTIPFHTDTESDYQVMDQIIKAPIPDPRTIYPHISDEMVSLMLKLTEKDKAKRIESIEKINELVNIKHEKQKKNEKLNYEKSNDTKTQVPPVSDIKSSDKSLKHVVTIFIILIISIFLIVKLNTCAKEPLDEIQNNTVVKTDVTPVNMIKVEGGIFQMGSENGYDVEKPVHSVTLSSFYMGKYQVTQKEWQAVMGTNPSYFKGDKRPVEQITWYQAVEFCNKLSQNEGLSPAYTINVTSVSCNWNADGYRLPTEAEWEFAARGGNQSKGYTYSGSNNLDEVGWYSSNSDDTHEVGTKKANELGIYDMSGNVWEWCWDLYDSYTSSAQTNPRGATSGSRRVLRGGCWLGSADFCRVSFRGGFPFLSSNNFGFRLARSIR